MGGGVGKGLGGKSGLGFVCSGNSFKVLEQGESTSTYNCYDIKFHNYGPIPRNEGGL
jgi:hypothetical protein